MPVTCLAAGSPHAAVSTAPSTITSAKRFILRLPLKAGVAAGEAGKHCACYQPVTRLHGANACPNQNVGRDVARSQRCGAPAITDRWVRCRTTPSRLCSIRGLQAESHAPYGLDQLVAGRVLELAAQVAHVHIHHIALRVEMHVPHL